MTQDARVLIVDDEADIRELLSLTLLRMGIDADCAADQTEAQSFLARNSYRLCLTDMRLPDGDGLQVLEQVQRLQPSVPVAVITAHGSTDRKSTRLNSSH